MSADLNVVLPPITEPLESPQPVPPPPLPLPPPLLQSEPHEPFACFDDSRRLTGPNLYFASTGAVLEALVDGVGAIALDVNAHRRWHDNVRRLVTELGWQADARIAPHAAGVMLALAAPFHQLFTATEVNEWAWEEAIGAEHFFASSPTSDLADGTHGNIHHGIAHRNRKSAPTFDRLHAINGDWQAVVAVFKAKANAEMNPPLYALCEAARLRHLPFFIDDKMLSVGAGAGSQSWPIVDDAGARLVLPAPSEVQWHALYDVPKVLVTGSNGKTTTVRLLAAMLSSLRGKREAARAVGYCCTEGVVVDGMQLESGDYSGPAGARTVLRHADVKAAVLETARGGILRRGLAVEAADVAIVTNISADHFGEYGIDNIAKLADVKLVVGKALGTTGTLVLNADDPVLVEGVAGAERAASLTCAKALFSLKEEHLLLVSHRAAGGCCCDVRDGNLWLTYQGVETDLGRVAEMPLSMGGVASYNTANIAAATAAAALLGVAPDAIAKVLLRFGRRHQDNPGRLEHWMVAGVTVIVDYAHNPEGLSALLGVAHSMRMTNKSANTSANTSANKGASAVAGGGAGDVTGERASNGAGESAGESAGEGATEIGRLGLLLGQAGNREPEAIAELASTAATFKPDLVVIKEIATMLRGRAPGEVPALLEAALKRAGHPETQVVHEPDEVAAARYLLQWAQAGDVVVLPIHQKAARTAVVAFIESKMVDADDR